MNKNCLLDKLRELKTQGKKALVTYIMAGDPDLATTKLLIQVLAQSGASAIELGVPFSDPVADGQAIQAAGLRSLQQGVTLEDILALVAQCRSKVEVPLVLMSYYNPIFRYGEEQFLRSAAEAGIDGVIIPDLPYTEGGVFRRSCDKYGLKLIPLVAPTTKVSTIEAIGQESHGFVYCVSLKGVTGEREALPPETKEILTMAEQKISDPIYLGFGISRPEQISQFKEAAHGFIVGSALVTLVHENKHNALELERAVRDFVQRFKDALN